MADRSIKQGYLAILAVTILLLLFTFTLAFILIVDASYSYDWKEARNFNLTIKSCGEAEAKARSDFEKGMHRLYFSSWFDEDTTQFPYNFYKQIEENYKVEVILTGDVFNSYFHCYNYKMDSLLSEKYRDQKLKKLYEKLHGQKYRK